LISPLFSVPRVGSLSKGKSDHTSASTDREENVAQTVEQFAKECSTILKAEPGPAGRQKVCDLLKNVLKDKEFVDKAILESTSERHLLYEDPDLRICI
jgi:hypothetical protein